MSGCRTRFAPAQSATLHREREQVLRHALSGDEIAIKWPMQYISTKGSFLCTMSMCHGSLASPCMFGAPAHHPEGDGGLERRLEQNASPCACLSGTASKEIGKYRCQMPRQQVRSKARVHDVETATMLSEVQL